MLREMKLGHFVVGLGNRPLLIAEMSGNHNQSLDRAMAIVDAAAKAGAHGVKFQTYTADTMTLDLDEGGFVIRDENSLWSGRSLYDLYREAHTPWEWHAPLFDRCRAHGMLAFSTPFDKTAVDFLEDLGAPCYKIASFENTDLQLIRYTAATGKPLIISTGMATYAELDEAVATAREAGCKDLILLKCTSSYPATPDNSNLAAIPVLRTLFDCEVGLSDHTLGIGVATASIALGATLVEKHFTLRRADGGVDAEFSMEPEEWAQLVCESERAWRAIGTVQNGPTIAERPSLAFRRSLYITDDLHAGDVFTENNLRALRPGLGLHPRYLEVFLGRTVRKNVARGTPLSWDLLG